MISKLTSSMKTAFDQMSRNFASLTGYSGGLSQFMDDLLAAQSSGAVGITSDAKDVDSLALGGGAFTQDPDTTTGLVFGFKAGRFHNGLANVTVAAGTLTMSASNTNYVEVDRSGTVSSNTTAFTSGRLPLYTVVTGASSISTVTSSKPLLTLVGVGGVNGTSLSTAAATKVVESQFGTISATASFIVLAPCTGLLTAATFATATAVTTSDTNYWTISAVNKGQGGAGTQALFDSGAGNTTKATGGVAMTANAKRSVTLITPTGSELNVTKDDVIVVTVTMTGSATSMSQCMAALSFSFTN